MTTPLANTACKLLLITSTTRLAGNEVLVRFSDGTAAIYDAEELEKLRPVPKQILAASPAANLSRDPAA